MDSSIFKFILRYTLKDQILILLLTLISFPFVYATLEVPKRIVNDAIGGANPPQAIMGVELDQLDYLILLCFVFLGLVLLNGAIKYVLNVYRGVVGERTLRRLRYQLFERLLRFPSRRFENVSQGELIPIIIAETEPLGGFVGEAYALPAFQGGLLLTYLFFIFNQDLMLGAAAVALYPFQLYLIPKLQRSVNLLGKERVFAARKLGERIGDTISGMNEVHVNDTSHYEKAEISKRLGLIFGIRLQIYKKKFFIKFLNNFLAQVTPFFFYLIGGFFVLKGDLSLGALVAVLAAYKDLDAPWKELLRYYQSKEDARIKYEQIVEQFDLPEMLAPELQEGPVLTLELEQGCWEARRLSYEVGLGQRKLEQLNFTISLQAHTAIVGRGSSGIHETGLLLARLELPTAGNLFFAGADMRTLPESAIGEHIGYVGPDVHLFAGTIRDNLTYPLRRRYVPQGDDAHRERFIRMAKEAGNSCDDPDGSWVDLGRLGMQEEHELSDHLHSVIEQMDMFEELFQLGLNMRLSSPEPELEQRILAIRESVRLRLQEEDYSGLVEPFDWDKYNDNLTVHENMLFGSKADDLTIDEASRNPVALEFLREQGLLKDFLLIGRRLAEIMVELFSDVDEQSDLFERFSFIRSEDLPEYRELLKDTSSEEINADDAELCRKLLSLTYQLCPARHRLGLIDTGLKQRILQARKVFSQRYGKEEGQRPLDIEYFNNAAYNSGLTLLENMLFGRVVYGVVRGQEKIAALVHEELGRMGLERAIRETGLEYNVGTGGRRLSLAMRQKLAFARMLVRKPDVVIVNDATSNFDPSTEFRIMTNLKQVLADRGLVLISSRPRLAQFCEQVILLEHGHLVDQGSFADLEANSEPFQQLLSE
ncbi:MAG: ABC transporter ATP-binding protein [Oceanospirillales bacterium]|nr:ABC transporter ATP-binding protein [Oceanospirillales bacterium]